MSNKRIEQTLMDNMDNFEMFRYIHRERYGSILKAMEQYGKECHADGMREGHSHGIAWAEKYLPELIKLRELVKAQKELIALYDEENLSDPAWLKESELREQIKTLEQ